MKIDTMRPRGLGKLQSGRILPAHVTKMVNPSPV
jgi:hypothetical protein